MASSREASPERDKEQRKNIFEVEDGDDPAGAEELGDAPLVLGYTSFEEPVVAASAVFSDLQGQDTDHELVGSAPSCTGTPATFLPAGSCTGTARDGRDCATRFAAR